MLRIRPDDAAKRAQALGESDLQEALSAMDRDGILVLEDVVSLDQVEKLSGRMRSAIRIRPRTDRPARDTC